MKNRFNNCSARNFLKDIIVDLLMLMDLSLCLKQFKGQFWVLDLIDSSVFIDCLDLQIWVCLHEGEGKYQKATPFTHSHHIFWISAYRFPCLFTCLITKK